MSSSSLNAEGGMWGSRCFLISNWCLIAHSSDGMNLACTPIFCSPSESLVVKKGCAPGILYRIINSKHRKPNDSFLRALLFPMWYWAAILVLHGECISFWRAYRARSYRQLPSPWDACLPLPGLMKANASCSLADDDGRQRQSPESEELLENGSHPVCLGALKPASPGLRLRF